MMRKALFAGIIVAAVIAGGAAPASAGYICLSATHDKDDPGPSVICVWSPLATAP